jgi:hypothetical protein
MKTQLQNKSLAAFMILTGALLLPADRRSWSAMKLFLKEVLI